MASRFDRKVRMLVVGALAFSALAASWALAKGTTTTTTYKCMVDPSTVYSSSPLFTVSGSGFPAGMIVNLYIKDRVYGGSVAGGTVGSDGTFSIVDIGASVFYPSDLEGRPSPSPMP